MVGMKILFFIYYWFSKAWVVDCVLFFFSSRRRHTRSTRDWSSDVCSSDLPDGDRLRRRPRHDDGDRVGRDRKSVVEGKSVDLGGRRSSKRKKSRSGLRK